MAKLNMINYKIITGYTTNEKYGIITACGYISRFRYSVFIMNDIYLSLFQFV